jgi:hypothetical protein
MDDNKDTTPERREPGETNVAAEHQREQEEQAAGKSDLPPRGQKRDEQNQRR